jgi:ubiquinone/menaquinone biosynthesis C-methylase UbiE
MNSIDAAKDKALWNSSKVVHSYAADGKLQMAEQKIMELLGDRLGSMRMLDLGIGGGRTTLHFEPRVNEYVGSDYAENMVEASKKRFPNAGPRTRFEIVDATDMNGVPDACFDFILFSFNGIDCVAPEDRDKVFLEVRRAGKPGGYFAFSTHNLYFIPKLYKIRRRDTWKEFLYQFYRIPLLYWYNGAPGRYRRRQSAVFRNGVEGFSLNLHYIRPENQVKHLQDLGFKNIRVFSHKTGDALNVQELAAYDKDAWLYYLCEI